MSDYISDAEWNAAAAAFCGVDRAAGKERREAMTLEQLRDRWREEACGVEAMGYSQQADRMRDCAADLDAYLAREQTHLARLTQERDEARAEVKAWQTAFDDELVTNWIGTLDASKTPKQIVQQLLEGALDQERDSLRARAEKAEAAIAASAMKTCATCRFAGTTIAFVDGGGHQACKHQSMTILGSGCVPLGFGCTLHKPITEAP